VTIVPVVAIVTIVVVLTIRASGLHMMTMTPVFETTRDRADSHTDHHRSAHDGDPWYWAGLLDWRFKSRCQGRIPFPRDRYDRSRIDISHAALRIDDFSAAARRCHDSVASGDLCWS